AEAVAKERAIREEVRRNIEANERNWAKQAGEYAAGKGEREVGIGKLTDAEVSEAYYKLLEDRQQRNDIPEGRETLTDEAALKHARGELVKENTAQAERAQAQADAFKAKQDAKQGPADKAAEGVKTGESKAKEPSAMDKQRAKEQAWRDNWQRKY